MKQDNCQTPERRPLRKVALVGGLGLLALAGVAAQLRGEPAPAGVSGPAAAESPLHAAPGSLPTPSAAGPAEPVRWQGSELRIDFDAVPLQHAIAVLALSTHTTVSGVELLLDPVPVTLHSRVSDVAAAWQHLLQNQARFSITCSASTCRVWITGEVAAPAHATPPGAEGKPSSGTTAPAGATPGEEEALSQPGGSC